MKTTTTETPVLTVCHAGQTEQPDHQPIQRQPRQRRSWTAAKLDSYAQALAGRHRRLINIAAIYRDQPAIYPLQIEASLKHLQEMREVVNLACAMLTGIEPAEIERIKPWALITKLGSLDYLLTEIILNVAMFAPICQAITPERTRLHIEIRSAFPALLTAYHDTLAQMAALAAKARQIQPTETQEQEEEHVGR